MNDEEDEQQQECKIIDSKEDLVLSELGTQAEEGHHTQLSSSASSSQHQHQDIDVLGKEESSIDEVNAASNKCTGTRFQSDEDEEVEEDDDTNNDEDEELAIDDEDETEEENDENNHRHRVGEKMSANHQQSVVMRNASKGTLSKKPKGLLNLKEILQMFNCSISQEQAWAILYELLNELKFLFETDYQFVNENKDKLDINSVFIEQEGSILLGLGENDVNKIVDAYQKRLAKLDLAAEEDNRSSIQSDTNNKNELDEVTTSVPSTPPSPSPSPSPTPPPIKSTERNNQLKNDELEKILTDTLLDQEKQLVQKQVSPSHLLHQSNQASLFLSTIYAFHFK